MSVVPRARWLDVHRGSTRSVRTSQVRRRGTHWGAAGTRDEGTRDETTRPARGQEVCTFSENSGFDFVENVVDLSAAPACSNHQPTGERSPSANTNAPTRPTHVVQNSQQLQQLHRPNLPNQTACHHHSQQLEWTQQSRWLPERFQYYPRISLVRASYSCSPTSTTS
jgi:hypothetical protein